MPVRNFQGIAPAPDARLRGLAAQHSGQAINARAGQIPARTRKVTPPDKTMGGAMMSGLGAAYTGMRIGTGITSVAPAAAPPAATTTGGAIIAGESAAAGATAAGTGAVAGEGVAAGGAAAAAGEGAAAGGSSGGWWGALAGVVFGMAAYALS